jgi:hypothetical protein
MGRRPLEVILMVGLAGLLLAVGFGSASSASATLLCKSATDPCSAGNAYPKGTLIEASTKAGAHSTVIGPLGIKVECASTFKGEVTNAGGELANVAGVVTSMSFTGCTNGYSVATLKTGTFSISSPSGGNGTLTLEGFETTVKTPLGFNCIYSGPVAVSLKGGAMASLLASSAPVPRTGHSGLCSSSGSWSVEYAVTAPEPLYVAEKAVPSTVLCKSATDPCSAGNAYPKGTLIEASTKAGVHSVVTGPFGIKVECASTIKGEVTNAGGELANVSGAVTSMSFTGCTNGYQVTVLKAGTFSISSPASGNGTLTLEGFETTAHTPLGFNCIYSGPASLSLKGGAMASIVGSKASIPRTGDSTLCGSSGSWSVEYAVTAPEPLYVAES